MDKNVILVAEIMGAIDQTEEWDRIQQEDPRILHEIKQLETCLAQVSQYAPDEAVGELEDTAYGFANAFASAAMLYGTLPPDLLICHGTF